MGPKTKWQKEMEEAERKKKEQEELEKNKPAPEQNKTDNKKNDFEKEYTKTEQTLSSYDGYVPKSSAEGKKIADDTMNRKEPRKQATKAQSLILTAKRQTTPTKGESKPMGSKNEEKPVKASPMQGRYKDQPGERPMATTRATNSGRSLSAKNMRSDHSAIGVTPGGMAQRRTSGPKMTSAQNASTASKRRGMITNVINGVAERNTSNGASGSGKSTDKGVINKSARERIRAGFASAKSRKRHI